MTVDEIAASAATRADMPEGLNSAEQRLYQSLRALYYQYTAGYIDAETGRREKAQIMKSYEVDALNVKSGQLATEIIKRLGYLLNDKSECEVCRKVGRILDGRDRHASA